MGNKKELTTPNFLVVVWQVRALRNRKLIVRLSAAFVGIFTASKMYPRVLTARQSSEVDYGALRAFLILKSGVCLHVGGVSSVRNKLGQWSELGLFVTLRFQRISLLVFFILFFR